MENLTKLRIDPQTHPREVSFFRKLPIATRMPVTSEADLYRKDVFENSHGGTRSRESGQGQFLKALRNHEPANC